MITNTTTGISVMEAKQGTILQEGGWVKPDPEVSGKPTRRRFTAECKLRILRLADDCTKHRSPVASRGAVFLSSDRVASGSAGEERAGWPETQEERT